MEGITMRPIREEEAASIASWAYEEPFDIYDGDPSDPSGLLAIDANGFGNYAVVTEADEVVGFCCFGPEARVVGQEPEPGTIDIGGGVRPDRVSQGLATAVLPLLMEFARERWAPERFRTAVASFNDRSTRLCLSAGFTVSRTFAGPGREFQELGRPAHP
jgi:[ribosomal protein S18]-alanine N-acetyltransferase